MSTLKNRQLTTPPYQDGFFGLLPANCDCLELHGFEVTLDGRVVTPELHPQQKTNTVAGVTHDVARLETTLA